jgi:hypothetical protein
MQITLQVEQALAVALQSPDQALQGARRVHDLVRKAHASLEPMHPGTPDIDLSRFFIVDVRDTEASALQDALLQTKGVTAAYIQPLEELP